MSEERLTKLRRMLKARTSGGEALKNYADNVAAVRREITLLEAIEQAQKAKLERLTAKRKSKA